MADQNHASPSSDTISSNEIVLLARGPAWGLPTACPTCLPELLYLKLAEVNFSIDYIDNRPDSDDLPALEYQHKVAYPSEEGGIKEFLKKEGIADLDSGFSNSEMAQIKFMSETINSCLKDALLSELWSVDNKKNAYRIYLNTLPFPVQTILYHKQQRHVFQVLGLQSAQMEDKIDELGRKAAEAYESLSAILGNQKYLLNSRPSSADALFLSHALFVLHVPLECSKLKAEFSKHDNLVNYAQTLRREYLERTGAPPIARYVYANPTKPAGSSKASSKNKKEPEPKERTEKVKKFKQRTKLFLTAQAVAILTFAYIWGISIISELEDSVDYEDD